MPNIKMLYNDGEWIMCREQHKTLYVYCNSEHNALSPHAQLAYAKPVCFFCCCSDICCKCGIHNVGYL